MGMAMPLDTVQDYITAARTLLQDEESVQRYTDGELAEALGFAMLEARRLRPELFLETNGAVPDITRTTPPGTAVAIEQMYRMAFVYFLVGHAYLRDEEEGGQAMAAGYMNRFVAKLLTIAA